MNNCLRPLSRILHYRMLGTCCPSTRFKHVTVDNFLRRFSLTSNLTRAGETPVSNCRRYSTDEKMVNPSQEEVQGSQGNVEMDAEPDVDGQFMADDLIPPVDNQELFNEIAAGDPDVERQLKVIEFEIAVFRERSTNLPTVLKKKHWIELLSLPSWSGRKKYLEFLFRVEKIRENNPHRKEEKKLYRRLAWEKQSENQHMTYGVNNNTMFLRIYNKTLKQLLDHRSLAAEMHGNHIIFDCSYGAHMTNLNQKYCAKQILFSYNANRLHAAPFHLKFCNFNESEKMVEWLSILFCKTPKELPLDITAKSYLDHYPKERLVYLTPHCKEELTNFDPNDVYIIGAYVDRGYGQKVSLGKAKNENLRMAKFPLDHYLKWQKGGKALPLNTVLNILLDFRYHNSWHVAFKNIARRNLCME